MKVSDLKEILKKCDDDMEIFVAHSLNLFSADAIDTALIIRDIPDGICSGLHLSIHEDLIDDDSERRCIE